MIHDFFFSCPGTLKNLKKLEHAIGILNKVFDIEED